ncbi:MAG: hypothetical protein ABIP35_16985 [Ginsengibacter sp.]
MKKILLLFVFSFSVVIVFAQKEIFDLASYTPPKDSTGKRWKKEVTETITSFTITNKKNNSWCRIAIVKSTISKGSIEKDFESEWQELIVKNFNPKDAPQPSEVQATSGWKIKTGVAKFIFNKMDAIAMLTTMSGYERCVSIIGTTNNKDYLQNITDFLSSVVVIKPVKLPDNRLVIKEEIQQPLTSSNGFAFTTTNFDDGWTSSVKEDWVEVIKGNIKVLLHYPKEGTVFPDDPIPLANAAWNILVAPRYKNIKHYIVKYISGYNRVEFAAGDLIDNKTGKDVYVAFLRCKNSWIEFISPDKNSFINAFGVDFDQINYDADEKIFDPLIRLNNCNKFAVAATDLNGKWTSDFSGVQQLYNVYTGNYAGMNLNTSNRTLQFGPGNTYQFSFLAVYGMVGNGKLAQQTSSGKFSIINNWQIQFSDIGGKPDKYDAYFTCVKGGRILWMNSVQSPGSGIFTGYGKAK